MSKENHPNIHAVGFTVDIFESFLQRLRGRAADHNKIARAILAERVTTFVEDISTILDHHYNQGCEADWIAHPHFPNEEDHQVLSTFFARAQGEGMDVARIIARASEEFKLTLLKTRRLYDQWNEHYSIKVRK